VPSLNALQVTRTGALCVERYGLSFQRSLYNLCGVSRDARDQPDEVLKVKVSGALPRFDIGGLRRLEQVTPDDHQTPTRFPQSTLEEAEFCPSSDCSEVAD
jgi:hypothetical protein